VATGKPPYVDPSALLKLYVHEAESAAMCAWRGRTKDALTITHHGRVEVANGIGLAAFRKHLTREGLADALASFDEDLRERRYVPADLLWRAALDRAAQLSRKHTPRLGCRSLDVLHVASALELGFKKFLTFDVRQQALAREAGLKVVTV
jgi:predicted nucleic acid-binding protein